MKYMLLICGDDTADASGMAPVEPWVEELTAGGPGTGGGVRMHGGRLRPPADAVTVRVRGGDVLRADGPFAETKEYIAGYDVLECDSLEAAVEAAAKHPVAAFGAVEVRAFWDDDDLERQIRALEDELTGAARDGDVDRTLACYAPDAEVFAPDGDVPQRGAEAVRAGYERWFAGMSGPVTREIVEFRVRVDESVAFSHALVRVRATRTGGQPLDRTLRVTTGYRAGDHRPAPYRWQIVHQHMSVPSDATSEEARS